MARIGSTFSPAIENRRIQQAARKAACERAARLALINALLEGRPVEEGMSLLISHDAGGCRVSFEETNVSRLMEATKASLLGQEPQERRVRDCTPTRSGGALQRALIGALCAPKKKEVPTQGTSLTDWAREEAARACEALAYAEWAQGAREAALRAATRKLGQ